MGRMRTSQPLRILFSPAVFLWGKCDIVNSYVIALPCYWKKQTKNNAAIISWRRKIQDVFFKGVGPLLSWTEHMKTQLQSFAFRTNNLNGLEFWIAPILSVQFRIIIFYGISYPITPTTHAYVFLFLHSELPPCKELTVICYEDCAIVSWSEWQCQDVTSALLLFRNTTKWVDNEKQKDVEEEEEKDNDNNEGLWSLDFVSLLMGEILHTVDKKRVFLPPPLVY